MAVRKLLAVGDRYATERGIGIVDGFGFPYEANVPYVYVWGGSWAMWVRQ